MYWDHMNGWGWTMTILWSVIWIAFLGVIAWVTLQWARGGSQHASSGGQSATRTAREVLDERLARGDIELDEYQRRREALQT